MSFFALGVFFARSTSGNFSCDDRQSERPTRNCSRKRQFGESSQPQFRRCVLRFVSPLTTVCPTDPGLLEPAGLLHNNGSYLGYPAVRNVGTRLIYPGMSISRFPASDGAKKKSAIPFTVLPRPMQERKKDEMIRTPRFCLSFPHSSPKLLVAARDLQPPTQYSLLFFSISHHH